MSLCHEWRHAYALSVTQCPREPVSNSYFSGACCSKIVWNTRAGEARRTFLRPNWIRVRGKSERCVRTCEQRRKSFTTLFRTVRVSETEAHIPFLFIFLFHGLNGCPWTVETRVSLSCSFKYFLWDGLFS